jgi:hypothetical protein
MSVDYSLIRAEAKEDLYSIIYSYGSFKEIPSDYKKAYVLYFLKFILNFIDNLSANNSTEPEYAPLQKTIPGIRTNPNLPVGGINSTTIIRSEAISLQTIVTTYSDIKLKEFLKQIMINPFARTVLDEFSFANGNDYTAVTDSAIKELKLYNDILNTSKCAEDEFNVLYFTFNNSDIILSELKIINLRSIYDNVIKPIATYYKKKYGLYNSCIVNIHRGIIPFSEHNKYYGSFSHLFVYGKAVQISIINVHKTEIIDDIKNKRIPDLNYGIMAFDQSNKLIFTSILTDKGYYMNNIIVDYNISALHPIIETLNIE